jgi:hypothetical protein
MDFVGGLIIGGIVGGVVGVWLGAALMYLGAKVIGCVHEAVEKAQGERGLD